jgi:hypothetical protein
MSAGMELRHIQVEISFPSELSKMDVDHRFILRLIEKALPGQDSGEKHSQAATNDIRPPDAYACGATAIAEITNTPNSAIARIMFFNERKYKGLYL